jgi:hypothetical protein
VPVVRGVDHYDLGGVIEAAAELNARPPES